MKRSSVFRYSDVRDAAEQFVGAIAEHAEDIWEPDLIAALTDKLTDLGLDITADPDTYLARSEASS